MGTSEDAEVRRWYFWSNFLFWAGVLCVVSAIAFIVYSVVASRNHGLDFWMPLVVIAVVLIVCVGCSLHVDGLLIEARFAGAEESIGVVEKVVNHSGAEGPDTCDIVIRSWVDGAMIRRDITGIVGSSSIGDRVSFRHNTSAPEDRNDVLFVGWRGHSRRSDSMRAGTHQRPRLSGGHLSVGRVTGVTTLAGLGGSDIYRLEILIERSGRPALHRRIDLVEEDLRTTGPTIRPLVLVRHASWAPDELWDVFFERWEKDVAAGSTP